MDGPATPSESGLGPLSSRGVCPSAGGTLRLADPEEVVDARRSDQAAGSCGEPMAPGVEVPMDSGLMPA